MGKSKFFWPGEKRYGSVITKVTVGQTKQDVINVRDNDEIAAVRTDVCLVSRGRFL